MNNKTLCSACLAVLSITFSVYAEIDTNKVDWTSAEATVEYISALTDEYPLHNTIPRSMLAPIRIPAHELWRECLNFEIPTNDLKTAAVLVLKKKETLRYIAHLPTFSDNESNRVVTVTFIKRIQSIKDMPRVKLEATNGEAIGVQGMSVVEENRMREKFFRNFDSLYNFLKIMATPPRGMYGGPQPQ